MNYIVSQVPDGMTRARFLPKLFGRFYLKGEGLVFDFMGDFNPKYRGGYWNFFDVLDDEENFLTGFMTLSSPEPALIQIVTNGFSREISQECAGIIVTLFALGALASQHQNATLLDHYLNLRDYAATREDRKDILAAID